MLSDRQRLGHIILFLSDIVILFLILLLSLAVRTFLPRVIPGMLEFKADTNTFLWFFPFWVATLAYEGAYTRKFTFWDEVQLLWKVSFFSTLAVLFILFLGKISAEVSRAVILLMGFLSLGIFPSLRISLKRLLINSGMLKSRALIIGTGDMGRRTLEALKREPNLGYEVVGFIDENRSGKKHSIGGVKIYGRLQQIERYVKSGDIQDVVIAVPGIDKENLSRLINRLQHKVKNVLYIPDVAGMAVIGTELRHFFHDQLLAVEIKNNLSRPFNYHAKRFFDYMAGIILFLLLLIPLAVLSVLIRITSKGPALLKQERIGKHGKPFKCYKFRSMHWDADERLKVILESDAEAKSQWDTFWKLKNDPRVTPIGKFLRKTSLDELPQIMNVLRNEMSLVGPRPYLPREWGALKEHSEIIHSVPPGITGLWQVSGRSDSSYAQRLSLDSWYVRNWNFWLDIVILLKTVKVVFKKQGAR